MHGPFRQGGALPDEDNSRGSHLDGWSLCAADGSRGDRDEQAA